MLTATFILFKKIFYKILLYLKLTIIFKSNYYHEEKEWKKYQKQPINKYFFSTMRLHLKNILLRSKIVLIRIKRHVPLLHLPKHHHLLKTLIQNLNRLCLDLYLFRLLDLFIWILLCLGTLALFPCLLKRFKIWIVKIFSKIFLKVLFEFGDSFELYHDLLIMASALGGCSISDMFRQWFKNFLGSEITKRYYFLFCFEENIFEWKSIKMINLRFWSSSHFPSAISIF